MTFETYQMTVKFVSRAAPNCVGSVLRNASRPKNIKPRRFKSIQVSLDDTYRGANDVKCLGDS